MLAVYSNRTPGGIVCIEYLHTSIHIYVYTLYTNLSSGAYCGGTVDTVRMMVAVNYRDSTVINTGSTVRPRLKLGRLSHMTTRITQFCTLSHN